MTTRSRRSARDGFRAMFADDAPAQAIRYDSAVRAVGETPESQLAWLIRFLAEDPATWHPGVRVAHADCLNVLTLGVVPSLFRDLAAPTACTPADVEPLHRELRDTVRELLTTNPARSARVPIPTGGENQSLVRWTPAHTRPATFTTAATYTDPRTAIFQIMKDLILRAGAHLIACPACQTPYLAVHKQQFCSPRCAQRARNQRRADKTRRARPPAKQTRTRRR